MISLRTACFNPFTIMGDYMSRERLKHETASIRTAGAAKGIADASDDHVLTLVATGSREAFQVIWERFGAAIYSVSLRRLRDQGSAEDATQEAFTSIWKRACTFDPLRGSAAGWLFAVARNAAAQVARHDHGRTEGLTVLDQDDRTNEDEALTRMMVHGALARIPEAERAVVEMAYFDDLSHSQIAERLSLPLGTVKTRIRSGIRRLGEYLKETTA